MYHLCVPRGRPKGVVFQEDEHIQEDRMVLRERIELQSSKAQKVSNHSTTDTHSHDNPAADTVAVPAPHEFTAHLVELETLIADLKAESDAAEAARPQMKPKK